MKKQALFILTALTLSAGSLAHADSGVTFQFSGSIGVGGEFGTQTTIYPLELPFYSNDKYKEYRPDAEKVTEYLPYSFKLSGTSFQVLATKPLTDSVTAFFKAKTKVDYKKGTIKTGFGNNSIVLGFKTQTWGTITLGYQDPAQADLVYYPFDNHNPGEDTIGKMDGGAFKTVNMKMDVDVSSGVEAAISYAGNFYDEHNISFGVQVDQDVLQSSFGFTVVADRYNNTQWTSLLSTGLVFDRVEVFAVGSVTNSLDAADNFITNYVYTDSNPMFSYTDPAKLRKPFPLSYTPNNPLKGCASGLSKLDPVTGEYLCTVQAAYRTRDTSRFINVGGAVGSIFNIGKSSHISIAVQGGWAKADITLESGNHKKYPYPKDRNGLDVTATAIMYSFGAKAQYDTKLGKDLQFFIYGGAAYGGGQLENFDREVVKARKKGENPAQKMGGAIVTTLGLGLKYKF